MKKDLTIERVLEIHAGLKLIPKGISSSYGFTLGVFRRVIENTVKEFNDYQIKLGQEYGKPNVDEEGKVIGDPLWTREFGEQLRCLIKTEVSFTVPVLKTSYFKGKDVDTDFFTLLGDIVEDDSEDKEINNEIINQKPIFKFDINKKTDVIIDA